MQEIARRIAKVSKESKLVVDEDEYVSSFKVELMDAVVQWCRGASFSEVCKVCPLPNVSPSHHFSWYYCFEVDGPIWGKLDSRVPPSKRASPTNDSSGQGHRERWAEGEIRKSVRDAGTAKFRYFLFIIVSLGSLVGIYTSDDCSGISEWFIAQPSIKGIPLHWHYSSTLNPRFAQNLWDSLTALTSIIRINVVAGTRQLLHGSD